MLRPGYMPSLDERVEWHLEDGIDTLHMSPDAWALQPSVYPSGNGRGERAVIAGRASLVVRERWICGDK